MRLKSAQSLPDVPSLQNWTPKQFKNAITKCLFDNNNSFYYYINRIAEDMNTSVEELIAQLQQMGFEVDENYMLIFTNFDGSTVTYNLEQNIDRLIPYVSFTEPEVPNEKLIWFDLTEETSEEEVDLEEEQILSPTSLRRTTSNSNNDVINTSIDEDTNEITLFNFEEDPVMVNNQSDEEVTLFNFEDDDNSELDEGETLFNFE